MRANLKNQRDAALAAKAESGAVKDKRIYVSLSQLVRLQHQARGYSFLPKQPVHSLLSGNHASRLRGRGLNFEELRRYQQGDDIRTIDWKVTARTQKPHVRVYSEERDRPVLLLVDQRLHMFFGSKVRMKSVVAAEAAALGAWRSLSSGDRVGALVFNDHAIEEIAPRNNQNTVMRMLRVIERMNNELSAESEIESNPDQLGLVLEMARRLVPHDALVVFISDGYGVDDEVSRQIQLIAEHNDILGVLLVDPMRETPMPGNGHGVVTDGSRQMELNLSSKSLLSDIAQDYQDELAHMSSLLRKLSAPLLPLNTTEEVALQIRSLIGTYTVGKN